MCLGEFWCLDKFRKCSSPTTGKNSQPVLLIPTSIRDKVSPTGPILTHGVWGTWFFPQDFGCKSSLPVMVGCGGPCPQTAHHRDPSLHSWFSRWEFLLLTSALKAPNPSIWLSALSPPCYCSVTEPCPTATRWAAAHQASLFSTISWSLLKFMSIESVTLTISSSATRFSFCLQSFPALGSWLSSLHQMAEVLDLIVFKSRKTHFASKHPNLSPLHMAPWCFCWVFISALV